jgi:hypothetical protein
MRRPAALRPTEVYAEFPSIAALAGVSVARIERWRALGQLRRIVALDPKQPDRRIWLYRLSDALRLAAEDQAALRGRQECAG